jgi:hypothetical protein
MRIVAMPRWYSTARGGGPACAGPQPDDAPGGARTVKQAIEEMDPCIARRTLVEPEICSWLGGGTPATVRAQR